MTDCKGIELSIGDKVVYVHGKNTDAHLETGIVTKFYRTSSGQEECSVGNAAHIRKRRIMKLSDKTEEKA